MQVLQVSSEIFPLLKTGGLADIAGALPAALQSAGCDVRVVLPGFPAILSALKDGRVIASFDTPWGETVQVLTGSFPAIAMPGSDLKGYVLSNSRLFNRPGNPYEGPDKQPYADNHQRFAALGLGAAHIGWGIDPNWRPRLLHCHDWHAGLAPAYLALAEGQPAVASVFTIHNLAYQGVFGGDCFGQLGLPPRAFSVHGLEYYGNVSFMKAGLFYAGRITTVSPTYAREIQTQEQGCGLDGLLRHRSGHLSGILNAVDTTVWNPATDRLIAHNYQPGRMSGKLENKRALQTECGLQVGSTGPLFAVVSRLTDQKGLPLVLAAIDEIVSGGGQLVVLGSGEEWLEKAFSGKAAAYPSQISVRLGYDESFAHRIFAGSDVTLVPSRFEPCGLTQMYGLKYGSLPLVRRVGGLADTVVDTDLETLDNHTANGFVFEQSNEQEYRHAVRRAFALFRRTDDWSEVQRTGMNTAFEWPAAAEKYRQLYQSLITA